MFSVPERVKGVVGKVLYHVFVVITVILCWVIFRADDVWTAGRYIMVMFGDDGGGNDWSLVGLYFKEYFAELITGVILAFTVIPMQQEKGEKTWGGIMGTLLYVCFIAAISYLIKGTYSPFIYFNF